MMIETQIKITKIEDLLAACTAPTKIKNVEDGKLEKKSNSVIPRGQPKSGRVWKEPKQRFRSIVKTKGLLMPLEKKQRLREELKKAKELSRQLKEKREAEKQAKKERRRTNLKKQEENERKNEVVQVLKNTAKIKRMKKKQLRMIQKRDITKI